MRARSGELVARARVRLDSVLGKALLGPISGRVGRTSLRTIEEFLYDPGLAVHVQEHLPLYPATIASYDFPPTFPPQFRRSKAFDARNVYRLSDVCVSPETGLVWSPEGHVFEESVGTLRRLIGWGTLLHQPLLPPRRRSGLGPVMCCPPRGFYHWLLEALPGFLAVRELEPHVRLLLPETVPRYMQDLLGLIPPAGVVQASGTIRIDELLLPALEPISGFVHPHAVALLRGGLGDQFPPSGLRKSFYVSRRRAPRRRMRGELEIEARLIERGFRVVFAEDLSLVEQIRLFSRTETVVAPHGAGLSNVVWSQVGGRLIEIFPADYFNDSYARLAVEAGLEYDFVVAEPDSTSSGMVPAEAVLDMLDGRTERVGRSPSPQKGQ